MQSISTFFNIGEGNQYQKREFHLLVLHCFLNSDCISFIEILKWWSYAIHNKYMAYLVYWNNWLSMQSSQYVKIRSLLSPRFPECTLNGQMIFLFCFAGLEFFETSAKENINVKAVFERLVDIICDKMSESLDQDPSLVNSQTKGTRLTENPHPESGGCQC